MKKITSKISTATLIFICIFCFSQCHKNSNPAPDNPYGLPNATQTGAGVFACRIDGVNFIAKNDINHIGGWMSANRDTLNVFGTYSPLYFQTIVIGSTDKSRHINETYYFQDTLTTMLGYSSDSTCLGGSFTVINVFGGGGSVFYSKIDTLNRIVSGTFNCRISIPNCDTINITDGRFDITYHY